MIKPVEPKKILCIHDLSGRGPLQSGGDPAGAVGHGLQPVALPTVVLSTHTGGLGTRPSGTAVPTARPLWSIIMHWAWILTAFIPATWAAKRRVHWPKKPLLCAVGHKVVDPVRATR